MSIEKKILRKIDRRTTEWLFKHNLIRLIVGPNGMEVEVTRAGREYIEEAEQDSAEPAVKKSKRFPLLVRAGLAFIYLTIIFCILIKIIQ